MTNRTVTVRNIGTADGVPTRGGEMPPLLTVTPEETTPVVVGRPGHRYTMTDYLGRYGGERAEAGGADGRQAYLVRQEAPELRAHFHEVDQFQVVLDGEGTLGRDRAVRGVVHYTDAFTTYGPLRTADEQGLAYFTLRRRADVGIHYMPEERERRRRAAGHGEHFTTMLDPARWEPAVLQEAARTSRGAAAYGVRLPAGSALTAPKAGDGAGDGEGDGDGDGEGYLVVLAGRVVASGRELPAGSLVSFERLGDLAGLSALDDAFAAAVTFPSTGSSGAGPERAG